MSEVGHTVSCAWPTWLRMSHDETLTLCVLTIILFSGTDRQLGFSFLSGVQTSRGPPEEISGQSEAQSRPTVKLSPCARRVS